jgi:hypothetical protein
MWTCPTPGGIGDGYQPDFLSLGIILRTLPATGPSELPGIPLWIGAQVQSDRYPLAGDPGNFCHWHLPGIISERKWARWLFEDSLNMVHRVMEGQGIDYSGIRTDEQINTFSRTTREIMVKALPRTEAHPFNNSEIFLNSLFLLDSDLNLLYVAQSEETRKKDLTVYRKLGFARIKDFIEKSLLVGIRERFATAPPPRGMLSFHSSPADYQNEKPFPYGICRFLLGYDVIIKPIYHNTVVVGYYGAMIPPNIFGQAMLDTLLFNAVVAFILSALILTYFAYWRNRKTGTQLYGGPLCEAL